MQAGWNRVLLVLGTCTLVYAFAVVGYVTTSPDVGLRTLLADDAPAPEEAAGPVIVATPGLKARGPVPEPGDRLVRIADRRCTSFVDLTAALADLRNIQVGPSGHLPDGFDLNRLTREEIDRRGMPSVVHVAGEGHWVAAEFSRAADGATFLTWLSVQSLPLRELLLSLVWFLLQLAFCAVAALAYWQRPYDRAARAFFGMCVVTLGAYVGGQHWWVVAGSGWLVVPLVVCALLMPVVALHFFLIFPRPKRLLRRHPAMALAAIYLPAAAGLVAFGVLLARIMTQEGGDLLQTLAALRWSITAYSVVAAAYFVAMLAAIYHSHRTVRDPVERGQMRWIWAGGRVAAVFLGVTLLIAYARSEDFAVGAARWPMFLASLSFMLAYSVAIVRHKLMFFDELLSRDMLYYLASHGLTAVIGLTIGLSILVPQWLNLALSTQQALVIAAVVTLVAVILLWLRDLFQQMIDRRFFREGSRLDRVVQQINAAAERLSDSRSVAEMMLSFCRDGLRVQRGMLYLQSQPGGPLRLVARFGTEDAPREIEPEAALLDGLRERGGVQRVPTGARENPSPEQAFLRETDSDLAQLVDAGPQLAGLLLLGGKRPAGFGPEDLAFLDSVGRITRVALHSARVVDRNISRLNEELQLKLRKIDEQQRQLAVLQTELARAHSPEPDSGRAASAFRHEAFNRDAFKGDGPAVRAVLDTVRKVAGSESSVLLRGESGTGKEVLARLLHENSDRRNGPLVRVHCAALSAGLLESELFGHVKGAFTGAHRDRAGRFEMAHGGTLFLDEIGDISPETQVKLLRVLQERCFEPVGGSETIHVDVRLITATHRDLESLIAQGKFREDLFYRLNVISITLPPLRERREDLFELTLHFLRRAAEHLGRPVPRIEPEALAVLESYSWPGNVRELENVLERACVLAEGDRITPRELPPALTGSLPSPSATAATTRPVRSDGPHMAHPEHTEPPQTSKPIAKSERTIESDSRADASATDPQRRENGSIDPGPRGKMRPRGRGASRSAREREALLRALESCDGNKAEAARVLGMPRSTYFSKLKKYGIA